MATLKKIVEPLYKTKGWIMFAGIMFVIQGAFFVLSIWGIIIAWLPIWLGVILITVSSKVRDAFETDNEEAAQTSLEKLGFYFKLQGIFIIVFIIGAFVIGILAAIAIPFLIEYQKEFMGM